MAEQCVKLKDCGRVAQLAEQCPFKAWVAGSNPAALTKSVPADADPLLHAHFIQLAFGRSAHSETQDNRGRNTAAPGSGFLDEPGDPDQDDRPQDCHQDAPDEAAAADAEQADDPAAHDAADNPENDIGKHSVAAALHDSSCRPAGNQTYNDPPDHPVRHAILQISEDRPSVELNALLVWQAE